MNWNEKTQVWEFWYTWQSADWSTGKEWRSTALEAGSGGDGEAAPAAATGKKAVKSTAKAMPKGGKSQKEGGADGDDSADKLKRKDIEQRLGRLKVWRTRLDGALATFHTIMESAGEWDFGEKRHNELQKAKEAVTEACDQSVVWKEWKTSKNFAAVAKNKYMMDDLLKNLKSSTGLEASVDTLEKLIDKLRSMKQVETEA